MWPDEAFARSLPRSEREAIAVIGVISCARKGMSLPETWFCVTTIMRDRLGLPAEPADVQRIFDMAEPTVRREAAPRRRKVRHLCNRRHG